MDGTKNSGNIVEINSKKLGGKPVFPETRIPVEYLLEYLRYGYEVEDFVDDYQIDREKVRRVISYFNIE